MPRKKINHVMTLVTPTRHAIVVARAIYRRKDIQLNSTEAFSSFPELNGRLGGRAS
jgi:hypothetical protein